MSSEMTPDEEYDFYADPANQVPTGKPRRRTRKLTTPIPVRFPEEAGRGEEARRGRRPIGLLLDPTRGRARAQPDGVASPTAATTVR